jgi:putative DNA primase/helicase
MDDDDHKVTNGNGNGRTIVPPDNVVPFARPKQSKAERDIERKNLANLDAVRRRAHNKGVKIPNESVLDETGVLTELTKVVLRKDAPWDAAKEFLRCQDIVTTRIDARLLHHRGAFYRYTGTHYRELRPESLQRELYEFFADEFVITANGSIEKFNPTPNKVRAIEHALQRLTLVPNEVEAPCWLDRDYASARDVLATRNGILDLKTRTIVPPSPSLFTPYCLPCEYDPGATCPRFDKFLDELWSKDKDSARCLQEIFGLLLTTDTSHHKIFMIVGPKRGGKGTIVTLLSALLGSDNVTYQRLASLGGEFGRWPLIDRNLCVVADARLKGESTTRMTETLLSISGGDPQTTNRKYGSFWTGKMSVRFLVTTNELPVFTDASGTIATRFIVLKMTESFYGREDRSLATTLASELSGILNWSLVGLERLQARGHFVQPASGAEYVQRMADLAAPVATFVREWCQVSAGKSIKTRELYQAYQAWSKQSGQKAQPAHMFGKELLDAAPTITTKNRGTRRSYVGVALSATGTKLLAEALQQG